MNIVLINSKPLDRGHHQVYVSALRDELTSLGHNVAVIAPGTGCGKGRALGRRGSTAHAITSRRGLHRTVISTLRKRAVDLVWETYGDDLRFRMSSRYSRMFESTAFLVTVHSPKPLVQEHHRFVASQLQRIGNDRLRAALGATPAIVHTRRDVGALQRAGIPACALPWPVSEARAQAGTAGRTLRLLFVGDARRQKGLDVLLDALRIAKWDGEFRWVGGGSVANDMLTSRLGGRINWSVEPYAPSNDDLAHEYRTANAVAVPYTARFAERGGASGVLLEALSHGRVVVGTQHAIGTLDEMPAGALVSDSDDPNGLAASLRTLSRDWRERLDVAQASGPAYIQRHGHLYRDYVERALALVEGGYGCDDRGSP